MWSLYAVKQADTIALSGTDDQCGAQVTAAAIGGAFLNPNGSIGIALSVMRPDGIVLSSTVDFDVVTLSGVWRDDAGNSGTFQFSPPSPAPGAPRRITLKGLYSVGFFAPLEQTFQSSQFSFGKTLPTAPSAPVANIIPFGGPPTVNCPGSFANPQALPGQLCLYERQRSNVSYRVFDSSTAFDVGDTTGAHIFAVAVESGGVSATGVWAVTIP